MEERDKILTIKEWIESFWALQEEDIRFFREEFRGKIKQPKELLEELKERMRRRQVFYKLFKHLSWRDLPKEEWTWVCDKLDEILARENLITETINKILDVVGEIFFGEEEGLSKSTFKLDLPDKKIIFH
uniref:Uncharacterized protein n=1 Tax=Caldimicrobium thiodismutans TaxID=1653476 RepID=A0A832GN45_9BACT